jgi:CRP-like cAMP-binding protein
MGTCNYEHRPRNSGFKAGFKDDFRGLLANLLQENQHMASHHSQCSERKLCDFNQPSATAPFLERISYGLGQHHHYFDEMSLLFETTRQHCRPRNVVLAIAEFSRTISRFHQNDNVVQAMRTFRKIRQNSAGRIMI